ncbi:MAG: hypothetical protein Q7U53_18460 [Anaerolineaceae bacterium]|nr:hypothetical protein [Anaerolineaceae bacterium]
MKVISLNIFTGLFIFLTILFGLFFLIVFINPHSEINPYPPPPMPERLVLPTQTATVRQLPPTWTDIPNQLPSIQPLDFKSTPTLRPSSTLYPTNTSFRLPTRTPTPTNTLTPTNTSTFTNTPTNSATPTITPTNTVTIAPTTAVPPTEPAPTEATAEGTG